MEATTAATYIEQLGTNAGKPALKQYLAAIRQVFDYPTPGRILGGQAGGLCTRTTVGGREVLRRPLGNLRIGKSEPRNIYLTTIGRVSGKSEIWFVR